VSRLIFELDISLIKVGCFTLEPTYIRKIYLKKGFNELNPLPAKSEIAAIWSGIIRIKHAVKKRPTFILTRLLKERDCHPRCSVSGQVLHYPDVPYLVIIRM